LKKKFAIPFKNMSSKGWQNLALVAVLTFYIILIGFFFINIDIINICEDYAEDYCAFWSAGKLINQHGFAAIYDLDLLTQFQLEVYPQANNASFEPFAIMYLPVFMIPFQILSNIHLPYSFLLWTLINMLGLVFYLRFFTKQVSGHSLSFRLILLITLSMPVFVNLLLGQVNIWLSICAGEFIRAALSEKPYRAGLWLGGWLLKPQLLILIIPFLLIQRSIKILSGFALSAITVLGISYGMIHVEGFRSLINILFEASGGGVASSPQVMMNWRMLGWHISSVTSQTIGWIVIGLGTLATMGAALYAFRRKLMANSNRSVIAFLGIFAATCAVTWHAHLPMSIILIPPMIFLMANNSINKWLISIWVFMPIMVTFILYILIPLVKLDIQVIQLIDGSRGFILNLLILGWAIVQYTRTKKEPPEELYSINDKKFA